MFKANEAKEEARKNFERLAPIHFDDFWKSIEPKIKDAAKIGLFEISFNSNVRQDFEDYFRKRLKSLGYKYFHAGTSSNIAIIRW